MKSVGSALPHRGAGTSLLNGFRKCDHERILSYLTDDVESEIPSWFNSLERSFDEEIEMNRL